MGQYHKLVNVDKREFVNPHRVGDGLKVWEQFASGPGGIGSAMIYLMVCPIPRGGGDLDEHEMMGRWHGDRVLIIGDYAKAEDIPAEKLPTGISADMIYDACYNHPLDHENVSEPACGWFTDISDAVQERLSIELDTEYSGTGWAERRCRYSLDI